MQRVLVSGISGAGKSTVARMIAHALDLPYVELDALHHGPGWVKRPEFESDVEQFSTGEAWITEDQYHSFIGDLLWSRADTVVWLDLPRHVVMRQVIWRTVTRVATRAELWNGNRERLRDWVNAEHPIRWAWSQHAARRATTETLTVRHPEVDVVRLTSRHDVDDWCRSIGAGRRR